AAAIAPFSLDIVGDVVGADLLAMAIDAAVCCVNVPAPFEHSRLRARINVRPIFVGFRIEMSDLPRGNDREADPRKRKRAEDSQEERSKRSEEHTSELQSRVDLVCRLLLEKKNKEKRET